MEETHDVESAGLGRPPMYNWDMMLNGKAWRLTQGEDYDCSDKSMRVMIRHEARKRGIRVLNVLVAPGIIDIQALYGGETSNG